MKASRRTYPAERPHGRRVRALHHAAHRAGDRPAAGLREQRHAGRPATTTSTGPAPPRRTRPRRSGSSARRPTTIPGSREMLASPGSPTCILAERLLLRRAVQPAWRATSVVFGEPQTTDADVRDRGRRGSMRRWPSPARRPRSRREITQPRLGGQGAGAAQPGRCRGRGRGGRRGADRLSVRHRARRQPAPAAERDLRSTAPGSSGRCRTRKAGSGCPTGPRKIHGSRSSDEETDVGLDNTTPQFTLLKYPEFDSPVVIADGIEARLIEAEAQLQAGDFAGMTDDPQRPPRRAGSRPARPAGRPTTRRPTCCSASGHSGSSPPGTGWATCAACIRPVRRDLRVRSSPIGGYHQGRLATAPT